MSVLWSIFAVLLVLWFLMSVTVRIMDAPYRRCAYCGAVLKFMLGNGSPRRGACHALVCRRCGRTQPWA